jgi:hypothetical protein
VLKSGGMLAITIQPKDKWEEARQYIPGMTLYFNEEIVELLESSGFGRVRVERPPDQGHANLECILGIKE